MTLVRWRRHLGWHQPTLAVLLALTAEEWQAWPNMTVTGVRRERYDVNLCARDQALLRALARDLCRIRLPHSIKQWQLVDGRYALSLQYPWRPHGIWARQDLYELTDDVRSALWRLARPNREQIRAALRRQRWARLRAGRSRA